MNPSDESPGREADAEAVGETVLKLLAGLSAREQLSAERIERDTGWSLRRSENSARTGASLGPDWGYSLELLVPAGSQRPQLRFEYRRKREDAEASTVCRPDFERYAKTLEGLGYQRSPMTAEHDRPLGWSFQRPQLWIRIYTRAESDDAYEHECVSLITVE
ncbi:hypothetical protein [Lysobacter enzymogenes]|uniref:hypothetical protein n=1 Tax=Lysobacter enzymogenes TaxID=69 RepID=UPI001AF38906|nr:hypothetical protein [Lysobacter enzymogenes]QQQ00464.1 hypothetical protein JHW41_20630 [Lysobacter enzymogenes]